MSAAEEALNPVHRKAFATGMTGGAGGRCREDFCTAVNRQPPRREGREWCWGLTRGLFLPSPSALSPVPPSSFVPLQPQYSFFNSSDG